MSRCQSCGARVKPGHRYCLSCAYYADGYSSGAHYADDFDGTTDEDAEDFTVMMIEELDWDQVMSPPYPAGAQERYIEGLVAGLKVAARRNARIQRELDEEYVD